jgi:hemolysin activation/secretion protein
MAARACAGALAYLLGVPMWAQAATPDPAAELQRQDRQRQELRQRIEAQPWAPSDVVAQPPPPQLLADEQPCVRIDRVVIEGVLAADALRAALDGVDGDDPPAGRCLGGQGITLLIRRLQQALVEQGYITSHAHVPEQDLRTGTLMLQIREGRVARIRAADEGVALPRAAWAVREGQILNLRDIEQSAENLRRLASLQARIQIEPGEAPGTSDLVVDLQARRPLRIGLAVDDAGSRSTGRLQGHLTLSWDNPLGLADFFYVTLGQDLGDRAPGPRGSRHRIVHYSVPWGYWLFGATWSANRYRQTVFGPYASYLFWGTSSRQELSVARVVHRDGRSKTTASVEGFVREANNFIDDLEVLVQRRRSAGWEAGVQHLHFLRLGTLAARLNYRHGTRAFGALPAPEEGLGQGTGRMRLATGLLQWAMPLETGGHAWQYSTQWLWQWGWTRLTPQDRFCIGGRGTVRGFDGRQTLCGDRGQLWRQELATGLPASLRLAGGVQVYAALDVGRTTMPGQAGEAHAPHRLAGAAVGLRGRHELAGAHPVHWDVFVGRPLARPPGFDTASRTAGFSLRVEF